jgi:acyl transferase domain-containing protein
MLEAFGIGLPITDAMEVQASSLAFATRRRQFCALGSVKGNIGHCGVAGGGAAAIKAALALSHRMIPPTINLRSPTREIPFPETPFRLQRELAPWDPECGVRRAGVTAWGGVGHNAHLVLEEPPPPAGPRREEGGPLVAVLSAMSEPALRAQRDRLARFVAAHPAVRLDDICFTLCVGRRAMAHRWASVVRTREELLEALTAPPRAAPGVEDPRTLGGLARAWSSGERVDWDHVYRDRGCGRVPLPGYPFERRRFCLGAGPGGRSSP